MPSQGVENEAKLMEAAAKLELTVDELKQIGLIVNRVEKARMQREQPSHFLDGVGFSTDYFSSEKAAISFLTPPKNDDEPMIVGGTTEKKVEVVINELLAINLQHEVTSYDQNDIEMVTLGPAIGNVVTRTNQIERDDDVWVDMIRELVTQRAVYVREEYVTATVRDVRTTGRPKQYVESIARKRLISGLQVYLGDITIPHYLIDTQPYIVLVDNVHIDTAKKFYGTNPRWKYVRAGKHPEVEDYFKYRVGELEKDQVQIITYMSYGDDEYQTLVSGVPMEPLGTKLPWETPGYNLVMGVVKTVSSKFALGRSFISSAKNLQYLSDEQIRLAMQKFRQAIRPPMAIRSNRVMSRDIWAPSTMVYGLKKDNFERLIDHDGVTNSEMSMIEFIEKKAEEFVGQGNLSQGIAEKGPQTAQEIMELQKQATKMLGLAVYAAMRLKRELTYLRIGTIFEQYTKPVKKSYDPVRDSVRNMYRQFTLSEATFADGGTGRQVIKFDDTAPESGDALQLADQFGIPQEDVTRDITAEDELGKYSQMLTRTEDELEKRGKPTRFITVDVDFIKNIPIYWFVNVLPKPKDTSSLDKIMFQETLKTATAISQLAQRPLEGDQLIKDFELTYKKKGYFGRQPIPQLLPTDQGTDPATEAGREMSPDKLSLDQLMNENL